MSWATADGTVGLLVGLRLSAVRHADFFAKLFWTKKRVFGYFFQKVTLLINLPYLFLEKIPKGNFLFDKDKVYVE